jgi:hypothetical protein
MGISLQAFLGEEVPSVYEEAVHDTVGPQQQEPESWIPEIRHLSASSIGMFRRCPEQFRQRYLLGRKEKPGEGLVVGSFFHETLEHNYRTKVETHEDRPLPELREYLYDVAVPKVLEANGGEDEIQWDPGSGLENAKDDTERITLAYAKRVMPRVQPVAVEQQFNIPFGAPVPLNGYLDVLAGVEVEMDTDAIWMPTHVLDTKTGKQARSKLKPDWRLQGTIYAAATNLPVEYQTISRAKIPKIVTGLESEDLVVRPTEAQKLNVLSVALRVSIMIKHLYDTIGPGEVWPTLGAFPDWSMQTLPCDFCGYRRYCPAVVD